MGGHDFGDVIGSAENIGVAEDEQRARGGIGHQPHHRFQKEGARTLATHQGPSHVEPVFRQQFVQVIAGHATGNIGVTLPNQRSVAIANSFQAGIDFALASSLGDEGLQLGFRGRSHPQAQSVVRQNLKLINVLLGLAGHDGVDAARVVADHAAQGVVIVSRGIGPEGQAIRSGGVA